MTITELSDYAARLKACGVEVEGLAIYEQYAWIAPCVDSDERSTPINLEYAADLLCMAAERWLDKAKRFNREWSLHSSRYYGLRVYEVVSPDEDHGFAYFKVESTKSRLDAVTLACEATAAKEKHGT